MQGRSLCAGIAFTLLTLVRTALPGTAADLATPGSASDAVALPKPAEVQSLSVTPARIPLNSWDDTRQLILTAALPGERLQDLTGDVTYTVADPKIVRVTTSGRVLPLANGNTEISARYGTRVARVPVSVKQFNDNRPINFANQVVPVFTKLGCK